MSDSDHPLHSGAVFNRSGRVKQLRVITDRLRYSFIPTALRYYSGINFQGSAISRFSEVMVFFVTGYCFYNLHALFDGVVVVIDRIFSI